MTINCKFAVGDRCLVAERIAASEVTIRTDKACAKCLAEAEPRTKNMVTFSLAISSLLRNGERQRARIVSDRFRKWRDSNVEIARPSLNRDLFTQLTSKHCEEEPCEHFRSDGVCVKRRGCVDKFLCPIGKWVWDLERLLVTKEEEAKERKRRRERKKRILRKRKKLE